MHQSYKKRKKIDSIIDNYNRVHNYFCLEDYISCIDENGEKYNFLVSKIIVNPKELKTIVILKETGYWNDFLSRKRDSTVKKILGLKFAKIEDPEKINQIKRSSCYC